MSKDIFNGKVRTEYRKLTIFTFVFASLVFFACATIFLLTALLYDKVEYDARIALLIMSGISYVFSVFFPLTTVLCIRKYPKYRMLTKFFIKDYVLIDTNDTTPKSTAD